MIESHPSPSIPRLRGHQRRPGQFARFAGRPAPSLPGAPSPRPQCAGRGWPEIPVLPVGTLRPAVGIGVARDRWGAGTGPVSLVLRVLRVGELSRMGVCVYGAVFSGLGLKAEFSTRCSLSLFLSTKPTGSFSWKAPFPFPSPWETDP